MARMMLCDAADDREAAYLVTDLSNGDATAWCQEHFTDLCATVTRAAEDQVAADVEPVTPQDVDQAGDDEDGDDTCPFCGEAIADEFQAQHVADKHMDELTLQVNGQESRTRRKLAGRPDSAATSLDVVSEPGSPRR